MLILGQALVSKYLINLKPKDAYFTAHGVFGDSPLTDIYFVEQAFPGHQIDKTEKLTAGGFTLTNDDMLCGLNEKHVLQVHGIHPFTLSRPTESINATPINTFLESRVLGPGKADGIILTKKKPDGQCERTEWQLWQFDDSNEAFPSNPKDGCVKRSIHNQARGMLFVAKADGCGKSNRKLGGFRTKLLGNIHLKINEAPNLAY